jgi:UPF0755 protein
MGVFAIAILVGLSSFISVFVAAVSPLSSGPKVVATVVIERRQSPVEITRALQEKGIVSNPAQFIKIGRYFRKWSKIKAGEYQVSTDMSPLGVYGVITSGISMARILTVREGLNLYEIGESIEKSGLASQDAFVKLCTNPEFIAKL